MGGKFAREPAAAGGLVASEPIAARAPSDGASAAPPPPAAAPAPATARAPAAGDPQRVRIGEGYPIEMGNSWSTSLFAKRVLDNKSIPFSYVDALKRRS